MKHKSDDVGEGLTSDFADGPAVEDCLPQGRIWIPSLFLIKKQWLKPETEWHMWNNHLEVGNRKLFVTALP